MAAWLGPAPRPIGCCLRLGMSADRHHSQRRRGQVIVKGATVIKGRRSSLSQHHPAASICPPQRLLPHEYLLSKMKRARQLKPQEEVEDGALLESAHEIDADEREDLEVPIVSKGE